MKLNNFEVFQKKQFLISELQRFYREEGFVPEQLHMKPKYGYPNGTLYRHYFASWNNALKITGLKINKIQHSGTLDGSETCSYCGKRANEIPGFTNWLYPNNIRYCHKHGRNGIPDYVSGILDINSPPGRGRAGEITVIKALKIGNEFDCNRLSCGFPFDLYHKEKYKKINVKTSVLSYDYNSWNFEFRAEKIAKTYICIGMSSDTKHVEHVWVVPNKGKIRELTRFHISNGNLALRNHEKWEVNSKIYNEAWQEMLVNYTDGKCKVFGKKGYIND